jgi:hypothetical protein
MDPDLFFDPFRAHQNRIQCFSPTDSDVERSARLRKDWKSDACSAALSQAAMDCWISRTGDQF